MEEPSALKVIGRYSYYQTKCLGQGSFGKVYQGFENTSKQRVAIKKIDFKMFEKDLYLEQSIYSEIKILSKFKHPNVVELYEVLNSKRSLYIIMEFCQDGDLKKYLKQRGRLTEEDAYAIVRQIVSGFRQLFREKVIHRDLKPANILVHNGQYKICDFGFSKYVDNVFDPLKSCVGSPIYMAPQILEKQKYSYKCDIWSLGVIYFELLHGSPPWRGINELDLLNNIKSVQLRLADCFTPKISKFVAGMLIIAEDKRMGWDDVFAFFGIGADSPSLKKDMNGFTKPMTPNSSKSVATTVSQNQQQPPPPNLSPRQQVQLPPKPMTPTQPGITPQQLIYQHQLQQQQLQQQLLMQQQKAMQQQINGQPYYQSAPGPAVHQPIPVPLPNQLSNVNGLRPLNIFFFEELAFRSHVCLEVGSSLPLLHRHNFSKQLPERFVLLLSFSVKFKFQRYKTTIEQLQDTQAIGFAIYQYQHAVIFHEDLIFKIRSSLAGEDFARDTDLKRILDGVPIANPEPYEELLRFATAKFMEELMEEVRTSDNLEEIDTLLSLLDNICDMVAINEELQKTSQVHLQKLMKERSEYRAQGLQKSVSKVNGKLTLTKKASRCCYF